MHEVRRSSEPLDVVVLRAPTLGVDAESTTGAVRLYERAGMGVVQRWDIWERSA